MEEWELEAREQIRDTVARYTHSGDSAQFDEFVSVFTEDGVLEVAGGDTRQGREVIRNSMLNTQSNVQRAMAVPDEPPLRLERAHRFRRSELSTRALVLPQCLERGR